MQIGSIKLRVIFNSFGGETIEAVVNDRFIASCPGGISQSSFEAKTLDAKASIKNFYKIKNNFIGNFSQSQFDEILKDSIKQLGSNLTTAVSLAFFASEYDSKKHNEFPNLLGNIVGGSEHSFGIGPEIQEILTIPEEKTMFECVKTNFAIWKEVKEILKKKNRLMGMNPESAWIVNMGIEDSLEMVKKIADKHHARLGIDYAASSIYKKGSYVYGKKKLSREKQIDYAMGLAKKFRLVYMEDPMNEDDFEGFAVISKALPKTLVCGDDLISSDTQRLKKARNSVNAVIVKPNQIGTVTDCLELMDFARKNRIAPVVSHRSKETCSHVTARLAMFADFAKFGVAGIRTAKLNELIRLWDSVEKPVMRKMSF
jgi:enolase